MTTTQHFGTMLLTGTRHQSFVGHCNSSENILQSDNTYCISNQSSLPTNSSQAAYHALVDQSWQRAYGTTESNGVSDSDNWQENFAEAVGIGTSAGKTQTRTEGQSSGTSSSKTESVGRRIQEAVGKTFGHGGAANQSRTLSTGASDQVSHTDNATVSEGQSDGTSSQHSAGKQETSGNQETVGDNRSRTLNRDRQQRIQSVTDATGKSGSKGTNHSTGSSSVDATGQSTTRSRQKSKGTADTVSSGTSNSVADQEGTSARWDEKDTQTRTVGSDNVIANGVSASKEKNSSLAVGVSSVESHQQSTTQGNAKGGARAASHEKGTSETNGETTTHKQTVMPVMKWRPVLRFIEFLSRDEQRFIAAKELASSPTGQAFHQLAGHTVELVQIEMPPEKWADCPQTLLFALKKYFDGLAANPLYHDPMMVLERHGELTSQLHQILQDRDEVTTIPSSATLTLIKVPDDSPFSI